MYHSKQTRWTRTSALWALGALWTLVAASASAEGPPPLRVIVELKVEAVLEMQLGSEDAVLRQRRRIGRQRARLEQRMLGSGTRVVRRYDSLPFVALEVPHTALTQLATSDAVALIEGDRLHEASLAESTAQVQASAVQAMGYDGSGWHVAVLDTGVETTHPALAGRTDDEACFSAQGDCPGGGTQAFGPGSADPCTAPNCYHGTHVAGIAIGDDPQYRGVAPGARLVAIQVFSVFNGSPCSGGGECALAYTSDIIRGLEHVYSLRDTYQIAAVNLSVGGGAYTSQLDCDAENSLVLTAVENLRSAGIATVIASGNDGFINALASPGCLSSAVSVGSVTKQNQVSSFSNSADFLDLLAPGSQIVSAFPGQTFAALSGTSMATPHVAGAWALHRQLDNEATVGDVLDELRAAGTSILDPGNGLEHPLIQLEVSFVPEPGAALPAIALLLALARGRRRR